ncbi:unnamed protein product [Phaedon cochleariae]|uniref:Uncharacterized protein n=1 Tax=Phaedon cochleariae TaxID=80249 RepID=A0A9P0GPR7_PHACE|nr:unnamed protein product [Phaedon cochleariae]
MKPIPKRLLSKIFANIAQQKTQIHLQSPRKALQEAESLVGYSFCLGQKWMENENIKMIEVLTKKLLGADVSFEENVKKLLLNDYHVFPWGLIILLISKSAGSANQLSDTETNQEVLNIQRSMAEVGDMLRCMKILHNNVQNLSKKNKETNLKTFSNNLFILIGDFIFARTYQEFATWKRTDAMEIICSGIRDFSDVAFMEPKDSHNRFIPAKPDDPPRDIAMTVPDLSDIEVIANLSDSFGNAKNEWIMRHLLGGTIMLSKCCQAALLVGNHPKPLQTAGHLLGSNLALAHQASVDYSKFLKDNDDSFDLVSAPLLFHLQDNPNYYEKVLEITKRQTVDYGEIRRNVRLGSGLEKTRELVDELRTNALDGLHIFPDNDAKMALRNIIVNQIATD